MKLEEVLSLEELVAVANSIDLDRKDGARLLTDNEKKLLGYARKIIAENKHLNARLTGSLMLAYRGYNLRREAHDIDILIDVELEPNGIIHNLNMPTAYNVVKVSESSDGASHAFMLSDGTKVDFLLSSEPGTMISLHGHSILCGTVEKQLGAKINYILNDTGTESVDKHMLDLMHLAEFNNIKNRPKMYKVLSNDGIVLYHGSNLSLANEVCEKANIEFQNTRISYAVMEITRYRLATSVVTARKLGAFHYEGVGSDAYVYLSKDEYEKQLSSPDEMWLIKFCKDSSLRAWFDNNWYEKWFNNYPISDFGLDNFGNISDDTLPF